MIAPSLVFALSIAADTRTPSTEAARLPIQAGHTHDVIRVEWSPDDRLLASYSGGDGHVKVWNVPEGCLLWSAGTDFIRRRDEHYTLSSLAWSPDQALLAAASANGTVLLWDARTGRLRWVQRAAMGQARAVAFSPDGRLIASAASPPGEVTLWEAASGQAVQRLEGGRGTLIALSFSDDGRTLSAGDLEGRISRWSLGDGKLILAKLFLPHGSQTFADELRFSADLTRLAVPLRKTEVVVIDTVSGQSLRTLPVEEEFRKSLAFSGDGKVLAASGRRSFRIFDLLGGEARTVEEYSRTGSVFALDHHGRFLAEGGSWGEAAVWVSEVGTGRVHRRLEGHPGIVHALAFSPDGKRVASASGDRLVRVWDAREGVLLQSLEGHLNPVRDIAFSPDGSVIVSAAKDATLAVWDARSGARRHTIPVKDQGLWGVKGLAFSPDGTRLLTIGDNASLQLWDTGFWQRMRLFVDPLSRTWNERACCDSQALSVAFGAGRLALTGHDDGTVRLWDLERGSPLHVIRTGARAVSAAFSPDQRWIVAVTRDEGPITVWDARTGTRLREFGGHGAGHQNALSLGPDGRMVTGGTRGQITLWDTDRGTVLHRLEGRASGDDAVALSPDGRVVATGGRGQNITLWDTASGQRLWELLPPDPPEDPLARGTAPSWEELRAERERRVEAADRESGAWEGRVRVTFEHLGEAPESVSSRESGQPSASLKKSTAREARGVWLRLHNDSPLPISIPTRSEYVGGYSGCPAKPANGRMPLCEGMEVGIQYVFEDAAGRRRSFGSDSYFSSILPPGTSVLFGALREHLWDGRTLSVKYSFLKEAEKYGSPHQVDFRMPGP